MRIDSGMGNPIEFVVNDCDERKLPAFVFPVFLSQFNTVQSRDLCRSQRKSRFGEEIQYLRIVKHKGIIHSNPPGVFSNFFWKQREKVDAAAVPVELHVFSSYILMYVCRRVCVIVEMRIEIGLGNLIEFVVKDCDERILPAFAFPVFLSQFNSVQSRDLCRSQRKSLFRKDCDERKLPAFAFPVFFPSLTVFNLEIFVDLNGNLVLVRVQLLDLCRSQRKSRFGAEIQYLRNRKTQKELCIKIPTEVFSNFWKQREKVDAAVLFLLNYTIFFFLY
ncbi:hypothetical protein CEXT_630181 [Caerostris extrusa]|uniref:Uncharacterized protein n=1 Tax=Caerostris extrusa TaxID=172846 RepID=A0AAV4QT15_CAEEX|nr:hypothetical protein CEXT_630181 [Caerostris extrusa]